MGWKGAVRSIGAAVRAAERDAKRRQKELETKHKQYAKMQELEQAAYEVDVYENHIEVIQSTHKECSPVVDWTRIASSKQPTEPQKTSLREEKARLKLEQYKPGILARLFNNKENKKAKIEREVDMAITADSEDYGARLSRWKQDVTEWKESVGIAEALLKGEPEAKLEAIENLQPFTEISNLGSSLSVVVHQDGLLEATVNVHGKEIVPSESKSLLKSGKLSVKKMPKGKFNEIYQDYVCSCVLRVANELFSCIPDNLVIVTAVDELLNSKTGHLEEAPILSAAISRSTMNRLNLETIDPSDSMTNFIHNMSFKKTKGFESVERLEPEKLDSA
ncbi:hypothetical protein [Idiomarina aminovorans]|uniref:hypothetical protein n=1 Tax=Idiomarina aminovorans TaxID=2914829 RepID=UPI0020067B6A|nr:hypothetical protein [Idiomarina sp. ATCH4]MCK7460216.1 hypothetical protein [Idiomarina sp. ATCH4]